MRSTSELPCVHTGVDGVKFVPRSDMYLLKSCLLNGGPMSVTTL